MQHGVDDLWSGRRSASTQDHPRLDQGCWREMPATIYTSQNGAKETQPLSISIYLRQLLQNSSGLQTAISILIQFRWQFACLMVKSLALNLIRLLRHSISINNIAEPRCRRYEGQREPSFRNSGPFVNYPSGNPDSAWRVAIRASRNMRGWKASAPASAHYKR